jgi:hypothetical protein
LTHAPAVFSAGTVNADFSLRVDGRLERGASLIATDLLCTSGGRAANVAVIARRLGTPARLFGCVGGDQLAEQALAGPRAAGVEIGAIRGVQATTGLVSIVVDADAAKTMVFAPGANDAFAEADEAGVSRRGTTGRRWSTAVGCARRGHDRRWRCVCRHAGEHPHLWGARSSRLCGAPWPPLRARSPGSERRSHIQIPASWRQPRSQCASSNSRARAYNASGRRGI